MASARRGKPVVAAARDVDPDEAKARKPAAPFKSVDDVLSAAVAARPPWSKDKIKAEIEALASAKARDMRAEAPGSPYVTRESRSR